MKQVSSNITGSLILNGIDVTTTVVSSSIWSGSFSTRVSNLESFSGSINSYTSSNNTNISNLNIASSSLNTFTGSAASRLSSLEATTGSLNTASGSAITRLGALETTTGSLNTASGSAITRLNALESTSGSLNTASGSAITRLNSLETTTGSLNTASGSAITRLGNLETASGSAITRLNSLESVTGSYATTSSNNFVGTQYISNTVNPTGFTTTSSLYTDGGLRVTKDAYISGTLYLNNVTVYGTQSVNYITSSQLDISDNIINVNTATPNVRFGGLAVYDSGSTSLTGSLLWDSQNNNWVYSNPSGSGNYDSSMVIMGPRNASTLGNEQGLNCNYLVLGHGSHHTTSSAIFHDGTNTCFYGNSYISSSGLACFANTVCTPTLVVNKSNPVLYINACNNETSTIGFTQPAVTGYNGFIKVSTGLGDRAMTFGLSAAGTNNDATELIRLDDSGVTCFSSSVCAPSFIGGTMSGTTIYGSTAVCSPIGKFTSCIDAGSGTFSGDILANGSSIFTKSTSGGYQISLNAQTSPMKLRFDDLTGAAYGAISFQAGNGTGGFVDRLAIASTGVACFSSTVCAANLISSGQICSVGDNKNLDIGGVAVIRGNGSAYNTHYFTTGASNVAKYIQYNASGTAINQISAGEHSYFNSGCNVGIGTTTPISSLMVSKTLASNQTYLTLDNKTNSKYNWGIDWAVLDSTNIPVAAIRAIYPVDNDVSLGFYTYNGSGNVSERMRITSGGEVGIGVTPTAGNRFWVKGSSTTSGDTSLYIQNSAGTSMLTVKNSNTTHIGVLTGGGETLNVSTTMAVRANLTGAEQTIFHVGNTGSGVNDGYMRLLRDGVAKVLIAADNSRGGDTYFNGGGNVGIGTTSPKSLLEVANTHNGGSGGSILTLSSITNAAYGQCMVLQGYFNDSGNGECGILGAVSIEKWRPAGQCNGGDIAFYTRTPAGSNMNNPTERARIYNNGAAKFAMNGINTAILQRAVSVPPNSCANICFDMSTDIPGKGAGWVFQADIYVSGYGSAGSSGLVYRSSVGGYDGHYIGVGSYHQSSVQVKCASGVDIAFYNPSGSPTLLGVTIYNCSGAYTHVGTMRMVLTY